MPNSFPETTSDSGKFELIRHLKNLFVGRLDVCAKRWQKADGHAGYAPICQNEWNNAVCKKSTRTGDCGDCAHREYSQVDDGLLEKHINGDIILGTYPIHTDNNVTFAAADFDDHQGNKTPLVDVLKLYSICQENGFSLYVLRSRSGAGYHAYLFFAESVPARKARTLLLNLLGKAGITKDEGNNSFDRVFPNQDELAGKGLGNLIALPFQGQAMNNHHTMLLDPDSEFREICENQLNSLSRIVKISPDAVTSFLGNTEVGDGLKTITQKKTDIASSAPKADFEIVRSSCSFIRHCVDDSETLTEPEWYAAISIVARCKNGEAMVHEISNRYPGYSSAETDRKITHALTDAGPCTCGNIGSAINGAYCGDCKYKGKVKSPIVLGIEKQSATLPIDIFGDVEMLGRPEWPEDSCPSVIDAFSRDEATRLGVCPSMIAMAAITVAAAAISDDFKVQPKEYDTSWLESPRVWSLLIAAPGMKKSPAQAKALAPLDKVEELLHQGNKQLLSAHDQELALYDKWKRSSRSMESKEKPEKPALKRKKINDATVEMMSEILKDNPDGILVHVDEMTRLIASFDCYRPGKSGKDRADYMELFNGGPRLIDRVSRGSVSVPNWSACILSSIQPGPARREFASVTDDGLLQRFDVHWGETVGEGEDRAPDYDSVGAYRHLIFNLALHTNFELIVPEKPYKLSVEARDQMDLVKKTVKAVMVLPTTSNAFRALLDKWEARFARYALIYHIIEAVSELRQPEPRISGETASRVARLMLAFLLPSAARFYHEIIPSGGNEGPALWIANYILSRGVLKVSEREIYRAYRELRDKPDMIQQAMKILTASGWAEPVKFRKDSRATQWEINPRCHVIFSKRASAEKDRRENEKNKIQEAVQLLGIAKCEGGD